MTGSEMLNEIYGFYDFAVWIKPDNIEEYFKECCFHFFASLSKGFCQKFIFSPRDAYHFFKKIFLFQHIHLAAHFILNTNCFIKY